MKNENQKIRDKIQQRRLQILIHSCIYYELNDSIVTDAIWSKWAKELVELQNKYPEIANEVVYAKEFEGFDGSTGMHLPIKDFKVINRARYLLEHRPSKKQPGLLF